MSASQEKLTTQSAKTEATSFAIWKCWQSSELLADWTLTFKIKQEVSHQNEFSFRSIWLWPQSTPEAQPETEVQYRRLRPFLQRRPNQPKWKWRTFKSEPQATPLRAPCHSSGGQGLGSVQLCPTLQSLAVRHNCFTQEVSFLSLSKWHQRKVILWAVFGFKPKGWIPPSPQRVPTNTYYPSTLVTNTGAAKSPSERSCIMINSRTVNFI